MGITPGMDGRVESDLTVSRTSATRAGPDTSVAVSLAVLDHGLRLLKMDAAAGPRVGLRGLHICAGHPYAAHLWLTSGPGVFAMETLSGPAPDPLVPGDARRAALLVRYFPSPAEPAWALLSDDERAVRTDSGFGPSGAPDHSLTRELFDTPLFGIGLLRLGRDPAGGAASIAGVSATAAGWDTLRPLLDTLVGALSFVHRTPPAAVVAIRRAAEIGWHVVLPTRARPDALADTGAAHRFIAAARAQGDGDAAPEAPALWTEAPFWPAAPDVAPCGCCAADSGHSHHAHHHHHHHPPQAAGHAPDMAPARPPNPTASPVGEAP